MTQAFHDFCYATIQSDFSQKNVLVVGDVIVDRYVLGSIQRISPEAPIPVFHESFVNNRLGGAGNVARGLKALGAKVTLVSCVGDDKEASILKTLLTDALDGFHLVQDATRCTPLKTRIVAQNQQILRWDREHITPLSPPTEDQIFSWIKQHGPSFDGILLSDYNKGVLTSSLTQNLIAFFQNQNKPIFVDPKSPSFEKYRGATWITPNRHELASASTTVITDQQSLVTASRDLIHRHDIRGGILATQSENGLSLITATQTIHCPTEALDVFDVSGAGDTVLAAFSLGILSGMPLEQAAALSNSAAGVVVGKMGTATVSLDEIEKNLSKGRALTHKKHLSLSEAEEQILHWRSHGFTVGFTNGCFDILHPGHISLLQKAKEKCDRLVLGLNSDGSIRRLKGANRPIHGTEHRVKVLEALSFIDIIVVFEDDTPLTLIETLKPHLLFKGADYKIHEVVGAKEMASWGGKVILLDFEDGHSTTSTIEKIQASSLQSTGSY